MLEWVITYGTLGLFGISFISATILPFSSEAALAGAIAIGISKNEALLAASAGNCLACLFNYKLGKIFRNVSEKKLFSTRSGKKAIHLMESYGKYSLFLSWLPIIGDPITIAAGISKINIWFFVAVVFFLRIARYIILVEFMF